MLSEKGNFIAKTSRKFRVSHFPLAFSLGNCYFEQPQEIIYAKRVIMLTLKFLSLAGVTLWVFYVGYVGFRRRESWKFVFKGRVMIDERAKAVSAPSYVSHP